MVGEILRHDILARRSNRSLKHIKVGKTRRIPQRSHERVDDRRAMDAEKPQDGIEDGDEHGAHQSGADVGQRHLDHGDNEVGHGAVGRGGEHQPDGQKQDHHEQSRNQGLKLAGHKAGNGLRHFDLYIFLQQCLL